MTCTSSTSLQYLYQHTCQRGQLDFMVKRGDRTLSVCTQDLEGFLLGDVGKHQAGELLERFSGACAPTRHPQNSLCCATVKWFRCSCPPSLLWAINRLILLSVSIISSHTGNKIFVSLIYLSGVLLVNESFYRTYVLNHVTDRIRSCLSLWFIPWKWVG